MKRLICLILIVSIHAIYAPTLLSNADSKIRIKVVISSKDSSLHLLNTKAESYLKRELRKYSDVEIVDDSPDYGIIGVAMELKTDGGSVTVYLVTITILRRHATNPYRDLSFDVFTVSGQHLAYDTDLEDICRDFAVLVDTEALERRRWIKRAAKESAERLINELEKHDK